MRFRLEKGLYNTAGRKFGFRGAGVGISASRIIGSMDANEILEIEIGNKLYSIEPSKLLKYCKNKEIHKGKFLVIVPINDFEVSNV